MISCLLLFLAVNQWSGPWTSEITERARYMEEVTAKGYAGEAGSYGRIETPWYYLMLRRSFLGGSGLTEFFEKK